MVAKPSDAWWHEPDQEWVHGERDAAGRLQGVVRYWNAAGEFISDAEHVDDRPHGRARRFYPDGSVAQEASYRAGVLDGPRRWFRPRDAALEPPAQLARAGSRVHAFECVYEGGDLIGTTFRDAEGREVDGHGRPIRNRPAGIPPTSSPFPSSGWLFMRRRGEQGDEILETREYREDGSLHRERLPDGRERELHDNGAVAHEGQRVAIAGGGRPQHGIWRYHDREGVLRRESRFEHGTERERTWHRTAAESEGHGVTRSGPVDDRAEIGTWRVRDEAGEVVDTIDLGPRTSAEALLADPVTTAETIDDDSDRHDLRHVLARIRTCGRTRDLQALASIGTRPAWRKVGGEGQLVSLGDRPGSWLELVHALRWGPPDAALLGELAAALFRAERPHAALDVVDAALLVEDAPALHAARAAYLRALGRTEEAHQAAAGDPQRLDERAERLLMEIRAAPDDVGLRLVFADHIAPTWPEHTTVIVAQCNGEGPVDPEILAAFRRTLPGSLASQVDELERGFLAAHTLYVEAEQLLAEHDALFRLAPACTELAVAYASDHVARLAVLPALRRYEGLSFHDTLMFDGGAAHLARSPHLAQLRRLGLRDTSLHDEDLRAILSSTAFPRLVDLDIGNIREGQDYSIEALRALPDAAFAGTLEALNIDRRYFGDEVVDVIERLPRLADLSLEGSSLTDDAIRRIAALPNRFTALNLERCGFGTEGAIALAASPAIAELRELNAGTNALGDEGFAALVRSPRLGRLRRLDLEGSTTADRQPTAAAARAFAGARFLATLEVLNLSLARIGPDGGEALARVPFAKLAWLNLYGNGVGDRGAVAIARSPLMATLTFLDLGNNELTDTAADALAAAAHARPELRIELGGATLSEASRAALLRRYGDRVQLEYPWNRGRGAAG